MIRSCLCPGSLLPTLPYSHDDDDDDDDAGDDDNDNNKVVLMAWVPWRLLWTL